uniref:Arf-GAP domain-containing protein n=3 Tax=Chrysotila carterae TaxID=13221 RepID=A0A6S9SS06_CHRCT
MSNDAHMKVLHQLRRLPENRKCGSCRHEEKLGFKDVCVKFQIFVCGDCKSAHQAYSHRCKSITMSNWNKDEVDALRADMGGGNARNSATTFAHLPNESALWPKKGCHPNELKEFIVAAYNDRKWFGEAAPVEAPQPPRPKAPPSVSKTVSLPVKLEWSPIWRWLPPYGYLDPARAASIPQVSATMLASHSSLLRLFTRSYTSLAPLLVSLPA